MIVISLLNKAEQPIPQENILWNGVAPTNSFAHFILDLTPSGTGANFGYAVELVFVGMNDGASETPYTPVSMSQLLQEIHMPLDVVIPINVILQSPDVASTIASFLPEATSVQLRYQPSDRTVHIVLNFGAEESIIGSCNIQKISRYVRVD